MRFAPPLPLFRPRFPTEGRNTKVVLVLRICIMENFIHFLRFIRFVIFVPLGIAEKEETLATTVLIYTSYLVIENYL